MTLTNRQTEVLRLIAEGKTYDEMGQELVIDPRTAQTHAINLYRRLEVDNRMQAIVVGFKEGILDLDEVYYSIRSQQVPDGWLSEDGVVDESREGNHVEGD